MNFVRLSIISLLATCCFIDMNARQFLSAPLADSGGIYDVKKVAWRSVRSRSHSSLPVAVDNSRASYFPPIIDQKGGSCAQASGIGYLFTYEMNRYLDRAGNIPENQFSYLFTWNFLNGGNDEGGFVDEGLNIAVKYGIMTAPDYGYASAAQFKWASGYEKYFRAMHYRGKELYEFPVLTSQDILQIKTYLWDKADGKKGGGALTFSTMSVGWKINDNYQGPSQTGYRSLLTRLGNDGAHALTIVGYDDDVEYTDEAGAVYKGAFIVVNSWGSYFHDKGHFYLPYYFFTHRGDTVRPSILSDVMTGVAACTYEPQLVYKVELDYSSRNDINVQFGSNKNKEAVYPESRYRSVLFRNQGGDYPMQGAYPRNENMEMAIDYTPHLTASDELHPVYFLNIQCSQRGDVCGAGKMKHLSLMDYRTEGIPREYTCRNLDNTPLKWGDNWFRIYTAPLMKVAASKYKWRDERGNVNPDKTYLLRTAKGKYAKLRMVGYDKSTGQLTIQYQQSRRNSNKFITD